MARIIALLLLLSSHAMAQDFKESMHAAGATDGEAHFSGQVTAKGTFSVLEDGELNFTPVGSSQAMGISHQQKAIDQLGIKRLLRSIDLSINCGVEVEATGQFYGLSEGQGPARPWQATTLVRIIQQGQPRLVSCQPNPSFNGRRAARQRL